jgi:hypothetical protein
MLEDLWVFLARAVITFGCRLIHVGAWMLGEEDPLDDHTRES